MGNPGWQGAKKKLTSSRSMRSTGTQKEQHKATLDGVRIRTKPAAPSPDDATLLQRREKI